MSSFGHNKEGIVTQEISDYPNNAYGTAGSTYQGSFHTTAPAEGGKTFSQLHDHFDYPNGKPQKLGM
jgi:hypothetical protein